MLHHERASRATSRKGKRADRPNRGTFTLVPPLVRHLRRSSERSAPFHTLRAFVPRRAHLSLAGASARELEFPLRISDGDGTIDDFEPKQVVGDVLLSSNEVIGDRNGPELALERREQRPR